MNDDEYKKQRSAAWVKSKERAIFDADGTNDISYAAFIDGYDTAWEASRVALEEPAPSFQAIVKEYPLVSGMRAGRDEEWSGLTINLWPNGDWNVVYMGKEYRIPMAENINKMLERIKASEETK